MIRTATATSALSIVTAASAPEVRHFLRQSLEGLDSLEVVAEEATGTDLVRAALALEPDAVVFDLHLPRCNGLEALRLIYQERPVAAVALAPPPDQDLVRRALDDYYLAYLIKPVEAHQLEPSIRVAWARFDLFRRLSDENGSLRQSLENRKLIERAKSVLMRRHRWSEDDAYRRLQRGAMNRRTTMAQLARAVLNGTTDNV